MALPEPALFTLLVCSLMLLAGSALNRRQRQMGARKARDEHNKPLDTVQDWPPQAVRVLSVAERRALDLLKHALPGFLVLAQVPVSRFIRVASSHSHAEWLRRAGSLSADLVICDSASRVLAVVDIRSEAETPRSKRRHERMAKVLQVARVQVVNWQENALPTAQEARRQLTRLLGPARAASDTAFDHGSKPMPLIPVAEMAELMVPSNKAFDTRLEPVPSAFFEDADTGHAGLAPR
jgi:Protein of unknown function (DUF2726)